MYPPYMLLTLFFFLISNLTVLIFLFSMAPVVLGLKTGDYNVSLRVFFRVFDATDLFCSSGVGVCCSGNGGVKGPCGRMMISRIK